MPIRIIETVTCAACGNSWTKEEYEAAKLADYPFGYEDVSDNWCPSCGEDGEVEDV